MSNFHPLEVVGRGSETQLQDMHLAELLDWFIDRLSECTIEWLNDQMTEWLNGVEWKESLNTKICKCVVSI